MNSDALSKLSKAELAQEATALGLDTSGTKKEIAIRISEHLHSIQTSRHSRNSEPSTGFGMGLSTKIVAGVLTTALTGLLAWMVTRVADFQRISGAAPNVLTSIQKGSDVTHDLLLEVLYLRLRDSNDDISLSGMTQDDVKRTRQIESNLLELIEARERVNQALSALTPKASQHEPDLLDRKLHATQKVASTLADTLESYLSNSFGDAEIERSMSTWRIDWLPLPDIGKNIHEGKSSEQAWYRDDPILRWCQSFRWNMLGILHVNLWRTMSGDLDRCENSKGTLDLAAHCFMQGRALESGYAALARNQAMVHGDRFMLLRSLASDGRLALRDCYGQANAELKERERLLERVSKLRVANNERWSLDLNAQATSLIHRADLELTLGKRLNEPYWQDTAASSLDGADQIVDRSLSIAGYDPIVHITKAEIQCHRLRLEGANDVGGSHEMILFHVSQAVDRGYGAYVSPEVRRGYIAGAHGFYEYALESGLDFGRLEKAMNGDYVEPEAATQ